MICHQIGDNIKTEMTLVALLDMLFNPELQAYSGYKGVGKDDKERARGG